MSEMNTGIGSFFNNAPLCILSSRLMNFVVGRCRQFQCNADIGSRQPSLAHQTFFPSTNYHLAFKGITDRTSFHSFLLVLIPWRS